MNEAIAFLSKKDEILKSIIDNYGHPVIQKREEGFPAMCHIILEQQVSIASAFACYKKINNHFGQITPTIIANCKEEELRICGVSRQKTIYLKDLAEKVINKNIVFESFSLKTEQQIREELITIKGVGNWSIEVYLMFCLQSQDVIPLGDIAIKNTIIELYSKSTIEEMELLSNNWKPYRTVASYILWHYYLKKRNKI
jgi:DNA-3-methyladenine glycosylase II